MHRTHNTSKGVRISDKHGSDQPSTTPGLNETTRKGRGLGMFSHSDSAPDQGSLRPIKERGRGVFPRSVSDPVQEGLLTIRNYEYHKHPSKGEEGNEKVPTRGTEKTLRVLECLPSGQYRVVCGKSRRTSGDNGGQTVNATNSTAKSLRVSDSGTGARSSSSDNMSTYFGIPRKSGNAVDRTQTVADVFVRTGPGGSVYYNITSWKQANNAVKLSCGYNSSPTKSRRVSVIGQQSAGSHETNAKSRRDSDVRPRSNVGNTKSPFSASVKRGS